MTADLSRLSAGERRVLALLAGGHTAKSAAAATGLSVNAVNERLREARRKTGVGSSRELARLVGPQENRDEKIGVADVSSAVDSGPPSATRMAWPRIGVPSMILVALLAFAVSRPAYVPLVNDALLGAMLNKAEPDLRSLLAEVRTGTSDGSAEEVLLSRYRALPELQSTAATIRALCNERLCEVAGELPTAHAAVVVQRLTLSGFAGQGLGWRTFKAGSGSAAKPVFAAYFNRISRIRAGK